ncbi:hypothetical protein [Pendulispora albinea]|uniref:Uncharacterized protein n=1 Tax=Pendulispora albinea TaxID=2741071 RepID=A0ABZ2M1P4_9BACT
MCPRYVLVVAALVILGGCSKSSVRADPVPSDPAAQVNAPAVAPPSSVPPSAVSEEGGERAALAALASLGLGAKLEMEAQHRPPDALKAEDVYAALERAGFAVTEKRQHVASIFGADFCLGAKGPDDLAFSVCEFATDEAAKKARRASQERLSKVVPNRESFLRKKSMLTIRQPPTKTAASEAAAGKAAQIFAAL